MKIVSIFLEMHTKLVSLFTSHNREILFTVFANI